MLDAQARERIQALRLPEAPIETIDELINMLLESMRTYGAVIGPEEKRLERSRNQALICSESVRNLSRCTIQ